MTIKESILHTLETFNEPMTAQEITDIMGSNYGSVSGQLSVMVNEKGWVVVEGKRPRRYRLATAEEIQRFQNSKPWLFAKSPAVKSESKTVKSETVKSESETVKPDFTKTVCIALAMNNINVTSEDLLTIIKAIDKAREVLGND
jgi:sugar-specific transcriptional regulator TrmB